MLTAMKAIRAMRILIADADDDARASLSHGFVKDGFEQVKVVGSGSEAMRELSAALTGRSACDLVCLGLNLSDRAILQAISEMRRIFNVTLLVLVREGEESLRREALEEGADDAISWPLDPALVRLKVEHLLTQRFLKREMRRTAARSEMLFLNVLSVMAKVLEAKDPYARFHSENVSTLASTTAREMGLTDDEVRRIGIAGILHDLGKLGIKEAILKKPGPLAPDERAAVERHPLIASTILEPIEQLQGALGYIRFHHEHYDGTGYPDKLAGEQIPLGARIVHLAEAFDTMTSQRAYCAARSMDEALAELHHLSGIQFDPDAVDAFSAVVRRRGWLTVPAEERAREPLPDVLARLTHSVSVAPVKKDETTTLPRPPKKDEKKPS
jgi:HD-GYP domain-containing protein (c-di-GMP phosphodiesterase class II)